MAVQGTNIAHRSSLFEIRAKVLGESLKATGEKTRRGLEGELVLHELRELLIRPKISLPHLSLFLTAVVLAPRYPLISQSVFEVDKTQVRTRAQRGVGVSEKTKERVREEPERCLTCLKAVQNRWKVDELQLAGNYESESQEDADSNR
jgi:hypothetical protein